MRTNVRSALQSGLVLSTFVACSSPSVSPATGTAGSVTAVVSGHSLSVSDGIAVSDPESAIPHVFVVLGSRTSLCPLLQGASSSEAATNQVANLTTLEFQLYQTSGAVAPGTFPVPQADAGTQGQLEADVVFSALDTNCNMVVNQWATSGTVTLSSLQPSVVGTYDLLFGTDHVTGSFDVNECAGVNVQGTGSGPPAVCTM
jgi:hypothetical protein